MRKLKSVLLDIMTAKIFLDLLMDDLMFAFLWFNGVVDIWVLNWCDCSIRQSIQMPKTVIYMWNFEFLRESKPKNTFISLLIYSMEFNFIRKCVNRPLMPILLTKHQSHYFCWNNIETISVCLLNSVQFT